MRHNVHRGLIVLALVLLSSSASAHAKQPPIVIVQALVGEAGFELSADHVAILHLLDRKAQRVGRPLEDIFARYCSPVRRDLPPTPRRAFIQGLTWRDLEERAPDVLRLVVGWFNGVRPPDPCRGRATHFDQRASLAWQTLPVVDCGPADDNAFYGDDPGRTGSHERARSRPRDEHHGAGPPTASMADVDRDRDRHLERSDPLRRDRPAVVELARLRYGSRVRVGSSPDDPRG